MIFLSANMYWQISKCTDKTPKKHYGGRAVAPAPPPPATLVLIISSIPSSVYSETPIFAFEL